MNIVGIPLRREVRAALRLASRTVRLRRLRSDAQVRPAGLCGSADLHRVRRQGKGGTVGAYLRRLAIPLVLVALATTAPRPAVGALPEEPSVDRAVLDDLVSTGALRVAINLVDPAHATKDPLTGELRGPAVDLGSELARRLGVPFLPMEYPTLGALLRGAQAGAWDIYALANIDYRPDLLDTTPGLMQDDYTYLLAADSAITGIADVDQPGVRIVVARVLPAADFLSATIQHAELVDIRGTLPDRLALLIAGEVDAFALPRRIALQLAEELPGSRVPDEGYLQGLFGLAVPKGRPAGLAYLSQFVEDVKAEGLVQQTIDRHGLRGMEVAPRAPTD